MKAPTQTKGRKTRRNLHKRLPLILALQQVDLWVPRMDFQSRNLGTGRPTIQCSACGEYTHWRRECPYDNFCTTCNNHDHTTHMCRAPRQMAQQSPTICVYCGSTGHSSVNCHNRPWDNREQLHSTPEIIEEPGISICQ